MYETPTKTKLNKSLELLGTTPIKYILRKDISSLSSRECRRLVRKADQAVNSVFEAMAPGQCEELKNKCFPQAQYNEEQHLLEFLKSAISQDCGRNVRIQLLSIISGKDDSLMYLYTKQKMMELFGVTTHEIDEARKRANQGEIGKYIFREWKRKGKKYLNAKAKISSNFVNSLRNKNSKNSVCKITVLTKNEPHRPDHRYSEGSCQMGQNSRKSD